jgi:hypothetical protein
MVWFERKEKSWLGSLCKKHPNESNHSRGFFNELVARFNPLYFLLVFRNQAQI